MIRELVSKNELVDFFDQSSILFANGDTNNASTTRIMDIFAPFIWLYTPKMYALFMKEYGFVLKEKINSYNFKDVDFNNLHHSSILVFERKKF